MEFMKPAEDYEHIPPEEDVRSLLQAARGLIEMARKSCWFTLDLADDYDTKRVICDGRNALQQAENGICVAIEQFDCLEMAIQSDIDRSLKLKEGVI